jgi:hypothetical protein
MSLLFKAIIILSKFTSGEMGAYLNSQVSDAYSNRDPFESDLGSPLPGLLVFACPNGRRFMPVDFCSEG